MAIQESLIADRLESLLETQTGDSRIRTLRACLRDVQKLGLPEFETVIPAANEWWKQRNLAIHELVKIEAGGGPTWHARLACARETALAGVDLYADVKKASEKVKRRQRSSA